MIDRKLRHKRGSAGKKGREAFAIVDTINPVGGIEKSTGVHDGYAEGDLYRRNCDLTTYNFTGDETVGFTFEPHEFSPLPRKWRNLAASPENLLDSSVYSAGANVTIESADEVSFNGTLDSIYQNITIEDKGAGREIVFTCDIQLVSGTITGDDSIYLDMQGNAISNTGNQNIGNQVDGTLRRFSHTQTTDASGTIVQPLVICQNDAIRIKCTNWHVEEVTNLTNKNPSDYAPRDTRSGPDLTGDMSSWVLKQAGFTLSDRTLTAASATSDAWGNEIYVQAKHYVVNFTVSGYVAGSVGVSFATGVIKNPASANGTYEVAGEVTSNDLIYIVGSGFQGSITINSINEATTGLGVSNFKNGNTVSNGLVTHAKGLQLHPYEAFNVPGFAPIQVPARYEHAGTQTVAVGKRLIVALDNARHPNGSNGFYYEVTVAGTLADNSDTWTTVIGGTTISGTATVECKGHFKGLGWNNSTPLTNGVNTPAHIINAEADWLLNGGATSETNAISIFPGEQSTKLVGNGVSTSYTQTNGVLASTESQCLIIEEGTQTSTVRIGILDSTAGDWVNIAQLTFSTGVVTSAASGVGSSEKQGAIKLGIGPNGGALWFLWWSATPTNPGNTRIHYVYPNGHSAHQTSGDTVYLHYLGDYESLVVDLLPIIDGTTRVAESWAYDRDNSDDAAGVVAADYSAVLGKSESTFNVEELIGPTRFLYFGNTENARIFDGTNVAEITTLTWEGLDMQRAVSRWGSELGMDQSTNVGTAADTDLYDGAMNLPTGGIDVFQSPEYAWSISWFGLFNAEIDSTKAAELVGYD